MFWSNSKVALQRRERSVISGFRADFLKSIFRFRGLLMGPPILFAALCTWGEAENGFVTFGAGGSFFAAGLLLRIWSQLHLRYRLKVKKVLTTTGPYAWVRNPIYIANTIMLVGAIVMAELLWLAPVVLLYCAVVYNIVVRFEEAHLLAKYGQPYAEYVAGVPRWIPRRQTQDGLVPEIGRFLIPSILAEVHNLWLLIPVVIKEFFT